MKKYFLQSDSKSLASLIKEALGEPIIPTDIAAEIIDFCPIGEGGNFWLYE